MSGAVTLWRNDWAASPMPWVGVKWETCDRPAGSTEYRALPVAEFAALTADRDALAALLGEARPLLYAMGFDRKAPEDILSRIDAALARIDAASGRKPC